MIHKTNIAYAPEHGERGNLDIFLPNNASNCPLVMIIHGGGLQSLIKERMTGVSQFIAEQGWVAVNVNYRLLPHNPFPEPLEDVLAAYRWIQETDNEDIRRQDTSRVSILGASAGDFLVLAMGMILGKGNIRSIVSVSGPSQRSRIGQMIPHDKRDPQLFTAPINLVSEDSPPIMAVHSRNDELVKPEESIAIVEKMQKSGYHAELYLYDGPGKQHGIWRDEQPPLRFFPHIEKAIADFLAKTL